MKPGDVVCLKSGGPLMTVVSVDEGKAMCIWFPIVGYQTTGEEIFESQPKNQFFPTASLNVEFEDDLEDPS